MKTVAVVSLKGGVGKTTLAANLGAALAHQTAGSVVLVDLDPRNQLALHCGLGSESPGLAQATVRNLSWARAIHRTLGGVTCLPFGGVSDRPTSELDLIAAGRPDLLAQGLASLEGHGLAILDTPSHPSPLLVQALALADVVLVALLPDAASFATLPSLQELLGERTRKGSVSTAHVLLNGLDGTRLSRDVRAVLAAQTQLSVLPFAIHRDQAVPEALGHRRTVVEGAPMSQAAQDFRRAAEWLGDTLMELAEREQVFSQGPTHAGRPLAQGAG